MSTTVVEKRAVPAPVGDDDRGHGGPLSWFVRRAGLARCTTIAVVAGMALAALFPRHLVPAVGGLALVLLTMLVGLAVSKHKPGRAAGASLLVAGVVLLGLLSGLVLGTTRIASVLDGVLSSRVGQSVNARVVVTGPVSLRSGWWSATAVIEKIDGPSERIGAPAAGSADGPAGAAATGPGGGCAEGTTAGPAEEAAERPAGSHERPEALRGTGEKVLLEVAPERRKTSDGEAGPVLVQGARLVVRGTLREPDGPSPSGYDQAKRLSRQGIRVVLAVDSPSHLSYLGRRGGVSGLFDRLRERAKAHLSRGPDARIGEVLQGVVMGDTQDIDEGWMEAFRRSGTAHMLSVSGLHVASLAAIVLALSRALRLSRRTGFVLAAAAALLMVPFVGASPPIVRSAAMMMVVLGGRLVGRRRDPWQGLAFAAAVVLAIDPFAVFDVGFQLSFSAFAGMLGLVRPCERLFRRLPAAVRANLAVSVAASLGTAPVSLLTFGRASLISPLANLVVVPTLPAVTGLGMASVLAGFLWSGLSAALDTLASLPMMWTVVMSTLCARVPVLPAERMGPVLSAVLAALVALPAGSALCGRSAGVSGRLRFPLFSRPRSWLIRHRPRDRRRGVALCLVLMMSAAGVGAAAYPAAAAGLRSAGFLVGARSWPTGVEVRVLDVGQGTAVLLRTPGHHAALFDAGPAGCGLDGQLRDLGVKRLDLVVVSHPHADHFAGLVEALGGVEVGTFVDRTRISQPPRAGGYAAGGRTEARQYLELRAQLAERGCRCILASSQARLTLDGVALSFYSPPRSLVLLDAGYPWGEGRSPPSGDELNGGSLVIVLQVGDTRILLPGDAEADTLAAYKLPSVDILVVGHHGSRGAVSQPLLATLRPRLAVVSVGKGNSFGHPDDDTLATLRTEGQKVLRTDESGWVSLRMTGGAVTVRTERNHAA